MKSIDFFVRYFYNFFLLLCLEDNRKLAMSMYLFFIPHEVKVTLRRNTSHPDRGTRAIRLRWDVVDDEIRGFFKSRTVGFLKTRIYTLRTTSCWDRDSSMRSLRLVFHVSLPAFAEARVSRQRRDDFNQSSFKCKNENNSDKLIFWCCECIKLIFYR